MNHDNEYHDDVNYGNRFPTNWYMNTWELQSYHAQQIKEYRDQEYHSDVNYGNKFPTNWYLNDEPKSQDDYKKCYKPHRTIHNY